MTDDAQDQQHETPAEAVPAEGLGYDEADLLAGGGAERVRPRRGGVLRWVAAGVVFVVTGAAAALGVAAPERGSLPGLRTAGDGRYSFAPLTLPALPSGRPKPDGGSPTSRHYADLRKLLLAPPKGATSMPVASHSATTSPSPSKSAGATASTGASAGATATAGPVAEGAGAWVRCTDYAARDLHPAVYSSLLTESACRQAAERVWTGPDGTRTELWLLRFGSYQEAGPFYQKAVEDSPIDLPGLKAVDNKLVDVSTQTLSTYRATEKAAKQGPVGRVAYLEVADVLAVVVMTNPKGVPTQAFRQVTVLQDELLQ